MGITETSIFTVKCDGCGYNFDGDWSNSRAKLEETLVKAGWKAESIANDAKWKCEVCLEDDGEASKS